MYKLITILIIALAVFLSAPSTPVSANTLDMITHGDLVMLLDDDDAGKKTKKEKRSEKKKKKKEKRSEKKQKKKEKRAENKKKRKDKKRPKDSEDDCGKNSASEC